MKKLLLVVFLMTVFSAVGLGQDAVKSHLFLSTTSQTVQCGTDTVFLIGLLHVNVRSVFSADGQSQNVTVRSNADNVDGISTVIGKYSVSGKGSSTLVGPAAGGSGDVVLKGKLEIDSNASHQKKVGSILFTEHIFVDANGAAFATLGPLSASCQ